MKIHVEAQRTIRLLMVMESDLRALQIFYTIMTLSMMAFGLATGLLIGFMWAFVYVGQWIPNIVSLLLLAVILFTGISLFVTVHYIAKLKYQIKARSDGAE